MTANGRHSYADVTLSKSVHNYKNRGAVCSGQDYSTSTQTPGILSNKWVAFCTVAIMVSAWFLTKVFVAVVPITNVVAQYSAPSVLPGLLDATADQLISGLNAGDFTSLDLVQVRFLSQCLWHWDTDLS
jgi:hypothetical protein